MNCLVTDTCQVPSACPETCIASRWSEAELARIRNSFALPIPIGPRISVPVEKGLYVYRHLDAGGVVLYVGRTKNPAQRFANHVASKVSWWFDQVVAIEYERYEFEDAAERREIDLIDELKPPCNLQGVRPNRVVTRQTRAQAST